MNYLNVFKNPYYSWIYPKGWIKNCKMFFRSFKFAWQRITRGYADCDTWDLDTFYLYMFRDTLNHLADHHYGYPGDEEFPEDEDWTKYLKNMADKFDQANEAEARFPHPMSDKWCEWLHEHPTSIPWSNDDPNPYNQAMFDEEATNEKLRQAAFKEAWDMMGHVFHGLWD